jgi:predicted glycosyltransferase
LVKGLRNLAKIWFDLLTPKHYLFYKFLEDSLDMEALVTIRGYEELERVISRLKIRAKPREVGYHGGKDILSKLTAGIARQQALLEVIKGEDIAGAVSFGSPDAARIAFGLGLPHIMVCDSPHSEFVSRLTVPLSSKLFTPWVIPKTAWTRYGIGKEDVVGYRSIDPALWVARRKLWPAKNDIEKEGSGAIIIREEEGWASYLSKAHNPINIEELANSLPDEKFIVLRRYTNMVETRGNVKIYGGPFFGPNIIDGARLFIGRGGTMTAEAALMGVPAISFYPGSMTYIDRHLLRIGAITVARDQRDLLVKVKKALADSGNRTTAPIDFNGFDDLSSFLPPRITSAIKSHNGRTSAP